MRFSTSTEKKLLEIGWFPGRLCNSEHLRSWFVLRWQSEVGYCCIFPSALRFLREFGGLKYTEGRPGITHATVPFLLDPLAAVGNEDDRWIYYEWLIDSSLFPIGVTLGQDEVIAISRIGKVYLLGVSDSLIGHTPEEALQYLTEGVGTATRFWSKAYNEDVKEDIQILKSLLRQM